MEKSSKIIEEKKNGGTGCAIVFFIIFLIIFVPILIGLISNNIEKLNQTKHEAKLIEEGKTKTHDEVINEIVEILKSRKEIELKKYLSDDFKYFNNERAESKFIDNFFKDLKYLVENRYDIEKRGNDIKNQETYRIYWNTNNLVKERADRLYCLQKITVVLNRAIKEDIITYDIEKIILTDN